MTYTKALSVTALMERCGVTFGTSGARGLETDLTDQVSYAYTLAFLQHLESRGMIASASAVAIAGDRRASTGRIMNAAAKAILDKGHAVVNCGRIPSPALALFGLQHGLPGVMVTGSHIPEDRNGLKYHRPTGEILKEDEAGIRAQTVLYPRGLFTDNGALATDHPWLPDVCHDAYEAYVRRYLAFFPDACLQGMRIGLYGHSSVSRESMGAVLAGLGAEVIPLGFSEAFVPVDTEAIRPEDVRKAREWAKVYPLDAIVSADGDGDRPLVSDEGGGWLRGDIAGILCAAFLEAEVVVTPVSSNTALERCGLFQEVRRTRIGSPYVIEAMEQALQEKGPRTRIVGYEANGGFLTAVDIHQEGRSLPALPTRDALIVVLAILRLAKIRGQPISHLRAQLPERFTASDRLQGFPAAEAKKILGRLHSGAGGRDRETVEAAFGAYFGQVSSLDTTDGLRVSFTNGEIVHLRPSGNAPEFRCYTEADSEARAMEMRDICMDMMEQWRT